ncbi:MAG: hypothetical protein ABIZ56_04550 [Chthoniobacteraceae bacterium]
MKPTARKPAGWTAIRQHLATWEKPALLALVKDLYDAGAENRDFLLARCQAEEGGGAALESYRKKIVEQFYPSRGEGKLKLGEARKAIRDYRKATGNLPGTAELLMTYVEKGAEFTNEYGDMDERFYSSIESALDELAALLAKSRDCIRNLPPGWPAWSSSPMASAGASTISSPMSSGAWRRNSAALDTRLRPLPSKRATTPTTASIPTTPIKSAKCSQDAPQLPRYQGPSRKFTKTIWDFVVPLASQQPSSQFRRRSLSRHDCRVRLSERA